MNSMPIVRNVFVAIALCLLASMAPAADQGPVTIGEVTLELPVLQDFSELPGLSEQLKGHWAGGAGEASVRIRYRVYPLERFRFSDPASVISLLEENYTNPRYGGTKDFRILRKELVPGPFGWAPYASIATATMPAENQVTRELFLLGGLLPDLGYSIEIEVAGHLEDVHRQAIDHFLRKGVTTNIEPWKAEWSMDEIRERWERDVPFDAKNLKKPLRTKHFLILTNSPAAGKLFGRKMEESYKKVQKMFPFDDVEGQRLMPVFIFKTREQYIQYYMHIANTSRSEAARSKGHAWRDYYATYYEAPNDPVHIHEATHQIFKNRLRLNGDAFLVPRARTSARPSPGVTRRTRSTSRSKRSCRSASSSATPTSTVRTPTCRRLPSPSSCARSSRRRSSRTSSCESGRSSAGISIRSRKPSRKSMGWISPDSRKSG